MHASRLLYKQYNVSEGLLQSQVKSIVQDAEGGMWFGTVSGLSYFNGVEFINYQDSTFPQGTILNLFRDSKGTLWVGTLNEGVFALKNGKILKHIGLKDGLPSLRVNYIFERHGYLWLCTAEGIVIYKDSIVEKIDSEDGLPDTRVNVALFDREDNLWVGTVSGVYVLKDSIFVCPHQKIKSSLFVHHMAIDRRGVIYAATRNGIWIFNDGKVRMIAPPEIPVNFITHVLVDSWGRVFFTTERGLVKLYKDDINYENADNFFLNTIYEDREKNLWLGTRGGGVLKLQDEAFTHYTFEDGLPDQAVLAVMALGDSILLVGTNHGMALMKGNHFTVFDEEDGLPDNRVTSFGVTSREEILIGTWKGLAVLRGGKISKVPLHSSFSHGRIYTMVVENDTFYLGGQHGLLVGDVREWKFNSYPVDGHEVIYLTKDRVRKKIWIVSKAGLYSYEKGTVKREKIVQDSVLYTTIISTDTALFLGTTEGLYIVKEHSVKKYSTEEGLPDKYIVGLLVDGQGNLWIGTNRGVERFDGRLLRKYTTRNGFTGEELITPNSIAADSQGNLWFGTFTGLFRYDPDLDFVNTVPPYTKILSVEINSCPVEFSNSPVKIPDSKSILKIRFVGLSFKDESDVKYSYRLIGYTDEWSTPSPENEVSFINLKPGEYTFQVKSANREGVWSNNIASVSFYIPMPFWRTSYFRSAILFAILFLIHVITQLRLHIAKKNEERLQRLVESKTKELEEKNLLLEKLAITDPLTGLYNRRYLNEKIREEVRRNERYGRKFSYIMIDVDGFKYINDTFGHAAGDDVLRTIASIIRENMRGIDFAARYGGDEFVVCLPETSLERALAFAERIRSTVERTVFELNEMEFYVTVSIGVHTVKEHTVKTEEELLKLIDRALYRAKTMGKNRIEVVDLS